MTRSSSPGAAPTGGAAWQAVLLAVAAGATDAIGVQVVVGVFFSFMSGNSTSTGIAAGTADWPQVVHVGPVIPIYVAGVVIGSLLLRGGRRMRAAVLALAGLLLVVWLVWRLTSASTGEATDLATQFLLALPMGMLTTTLRSVGPASVGLGYVTGTLVSFGEQLARLLAGDPERSTRATLLYATLWLSFFGGAAAGAALFTGIGATAIVLPIAAITVVTVSVGADDRRAPTLTAARSDR